MVRSIKFALFIMIGLIALSGCSEDTGMKDNKYSLEDIIAAIESQDVELISYGITGYPLKLKEVIPEVYSIGAPTLTSGEQVDPEFLQFYIFNTEQDRIKGVKEFNKQMKNAPFTTFPFLYEKGNVLVIYWSHSKDNAQLGKSIETALEQL